jgi:hypothetical protein
VKWADDSTEIAYGAFSKPSGAYVETQGQMMRMQPTAMNPRRQDMHHERVAMSSGTSRLTRGLLSAQLGGDGPSMRIPALIVFVPAVCAGRAQSVVEETKKRNSLTGRLSSIADRLTSGSLGLSTSFPSSATQRYSPSSKTRLYFSLRHPRVHSSRPRESTTSTTPLASPCPPGSCLHSPPPRPLLLSGI